MENFVLIDESRTDEHSDFLSYTASNKQCIRFVAMSIIPLAVSMITIAIAAHHISEKYVLEFYPFLCGIIGGGLGILSFLIMLFTRTVTSLRCSSYGLIISTLTNRGERCIKWREIKILKRNTRRHSKSTTLTMNDGSSLNLALIPALIQDNLALIMSEATNARVIGFNHNE